jgi:hypothetical protein
MASMIVGHYGVSFVATGAERRLPLWHTMIAVVWLDVVHSSLVLFGIEHATVVPGITAVVPMDITYYPYSHSLLAAVLWSVVALGLYWRVGRRAAAWMAFCVFSHWVLDLVTHRPDLPHLGGGPPKLGLGLWNSIAGTFVVETAAVFGPLGWLMRRSRPTTAARRWGLGILAVAGTAMFFTFPYVTFPENADLAEAFALAMYLVVAVVAWKCEPEAMVQTASAAGSSRGG